MSLTSNESTSTQPTARAPMTSHNMTSGDGSFIVRQSPGKGLGLFAIKDIPRGTLILCERRLLSKPATQYDDALHREQVLREFNQLSPQDRASYLNLSYNDLKLNQITDSDNKLPHTSALVLSILRTNVFKDGVFATISRFNHSCLPNCVCSPDAANGIMSVHTARDIKIGEELTISYIYTLTETAESRADELANWGITCTCSCCGQPSKRAETDAIRSNLKRTIADLDFLRCCLAYRQTGHFTSALPNGIKGQALLQGPITADPSDRNRSINPISEMNRLESLLKADGSDTWETARLLAIAADCAYLVSVSDTSRFSEAARNKAYHFYDTSLAIEASCLGVESKNYQRSLAAIKQQKASLDWFKFEHLAVS